MQLAQSLQKAAEIGDTDAQAALGWMYFKGEGAPQDHARALKLLREAADQGNAKAQAALGVMYLKGQGAPRDFAQARMWFNLSAFRAEDARTRELASKFRDLFVAKMTPDQIAEARQMASVWAPKK
jgi:uncharacterized protein